MKTPVLLGVGSAIALALMLALVVNVRSQSTDGLSDFAAFYAGAWSLATGDLYDTEQLHRIELEHTGKYSPGHGYVRPPFHAVLIWPLSRLPYHSAHLLWNLVLAASLVGFIALWRPPDFWQTLLFTCMCFPAFAAFINGQDVPVILLWLAVSMKLQARQKPFAAGVVFSLCAIKFQLFVLTPVLLVAQGSWRFTRGLLTGGAVLAAVSFLAAGWSWPQRMYETATTAEFSPNPGLMPNLHGVLSYHPFSSWLELAVSLSVVVAVWVVARRMSFPYALACSLAGGLLISYHAYLPDYALLLPACLTVFVTTEMLLLRGLALFLLLPPAHLLASVGYPTSLPVVAAILLLVYLMAYEAWRQGRESKPA